MKYRIWDKKENKYLTDEFVIDKNNEILHICPEGIFSFKDYGYSKNDYTIQMATGLKDKNGVEIYDGDIVYDGDRKYEICFGNIGYDSSHNGLTGFSFKEYTTGYDEKKFMELCYGDEYKNYEVIGNIFGNEMEGKE